MSFAFPELKAKEQRGSKPRCHLLTNGSAYVVASRLTELVQPFAIVTANDTWMPAGFDDIEEAQLDKAPRLLTSQRRHQLAEWWLPPGRHSARTPNFDIASTCTVGDKPGLLLVEAKAHEGELVNESAGRRCSPNDSDERKASHETIGAAIEQARVGFSKATGLNWSISRDRCYQMSNRFAWSWKLAQMGIPVVLVYLGFLKAADMSKPGETPLADEADWDRLVRSQSEALFPGGVWNDQWADDGVPFIPLIRSIELSLDLRTRSQAA